MMKMFIRSCSFVVLLGCLFVFALTQQHSNNSNNSINSSKMTAKNGLVRRGLLSSDPQTRTLKELYLVEPMKVVEYRVREWMALLPTKYEHAEKDPAMRSSHTRFFPFEPLASCRTEEAIGGEARADSSKLVCGVSNLQTPGCIIYSFGSDNNWDFETDLLRKTACQIHTFDCTGPRERFTNKPSDNRVHFHHVCVGFTHAPPEKCTHDHALCGETKTLYQMQTMLGHDTVDVLKMDVEGWEIPIIRSWADTPGTKFPRQILLELHWRTQFLQVPVPNEDRSYRDNLVEVLTPRETVDFCRLLLEMGYVTAQKDDNAKCAHCSELTLINVKDYADPSTWMTTNTVM